MKNLLFITACFFAIIPVANSQDAKHLLRDFTPMYLIDSFEIKGNPTLLKRRVISIQHSEGIKSAYWHADSQVLTVQYNWKIVELAEIKNYFYSKEQPSLDRENLKQNPRSRKSP